MFGIEFFAGSCSIGKAAKSLGIGVMSTDNIQYGAIDYVVDIFNFDYQIVKNVPDFLWFSPPCTGFSVAAIGHHWTGGKNGYIPKTETAVLGINLAKKCLEIITHYERLNPNIEWWLENPRGLLRKMDFMLPLKRHTVWYCQYGDTRAKPTDIWTNSVNWIPRPVCHNGNKLCHHEAAPRGAKTGTQGLKGAHERSKIPYQLCMEIMRSLKKPINGSLF